MNYAKLTTRLLILWLVVWDVIGWVGYKRQGGGQFAMEMAGDHASTLYQTAAHDIASGTALEQLAAFWGFLVPLAFIVVALVARWAWKRLRFPI